MSEVILVSQQRRFSIDEVTKEGSEAFRVYFDTFSTQPELAKLCVGAVDPITALTVPSKKGEFLDKVNWPEVVVDRISIQPAEGQNRYLLVEVSYGRIELPEFDIPDRVFDRMPWDMPHVPTWGHINDQAILVTGTDGNPILNSAGNRFDTEILVDRSLRTISIQFNLPLAAIDAKSSGDFINKINKTPLNIMGETFPNRTMKCGAYDATVETAQVNVGDDVIEVQYRSANVNYIYDPLTHDGYILDIGNKEKGAKGNIKDGFLDNFSSPQLLNGGGKRLLKKDGVNFNALDFGNPNLDTDRSVADVAAFIKYKKYEEVNLNQVGA